MSPFSEHSSTLIFLDALSALKAVNHSLLLKRLSFASCDLSLLPPSSFLPLCLLLPVSFSSIFFFLTSKGWHFSRLGSKCSSFLILYCLPQQSHTHQMLSSTVTYMRMTLQFIWPAQTSPLSCRLTYSATFSLQLLGCIKGIQVGNVLNRTQSSPLSNLLPVFIIFVK